MSKPVLALETSTPVCSVALYDGTRLRQRTISGPGVHSENVFVFVQELLDESSLRIGELGALLVSAGPGSYTGLRIASSAAKGLLFGTSVPLVAVETLAGIAAGAAKAAAPAGRIHAVINARRTHLYHQAFEAREAAAPRPVSRAALLLLADIRAQLRPGDLLAGTGHARLETDTRPAVSGKVSIVPEAKALSAAHLISLYRLQGRAFCQEVEPESFEPRYQPQ